MQSTDADIQEPVTENAIKMLTYKPVEPDKTGRLFYT